MPIPAQNPYQMLLAELMFRQLYNKSMKQLQQQEFRTQQVNRMIALPFSNLPMSAKMPPIAPALAVDTLEQAKITEQYKQAQTQYQPESRERATVTPGTPENQSITSPYHKTPLGRGRITGFDQGMVGTPMNIQNGMTVLRPQRVLPQPYPEQRIKT